MNKLAVIVVSLALLISSYITYAICGNILGELEPILDEYAQQYPQWFEWYDYYKLAWNWSPIIILIAIIIWMYVKGNEDEFGTEYKPIRPF